MASPNEYRSNPDAGQAHASTGRVIKTKSAKQGNKQQYWFITWWIDRTAEDGSIEKQDVVDNYDWNDLYNQNDEKVEYLKMIKERGDKSGKMHWHGFLALFNKKRMRLSQVRKLIVGKNKGSMWALNLQPIKGNQEQVDKYLMKTVEWHKEWGTLPKQYSRKDAYEAKHKAKKDRINDEIKEIYGLFRSGMTWEQFMENEGYLCVQYRTVAKEIYEQVRKEVDQQANRKEAESITLNKYQESWLKMLEDQNDRQIAWVCDPKGGKGKTTFIKWLYGMKGSDEVFVIGSGKANDLMYGYEGQQYVVMNLARSQEGYISYKAIEDFKDGLCISTKYAGRKIIKVKSNVKIIIMANWRPDTSKLSDDRWLIKMYPRNDSCYPVKIGLRSAGLQCTESLKEDLNEDQNESSDDEDEPCINKWRRYHSRIKYMKKGPKQPNQVTKSIVTTKIDHEEDDPGESECESVSDGMLDIINKFNKISIMSDVD